MGGASGISEENFNSIDHQFKSTKHQTITHDPSIQVMDTSQMEKQSYTKRSRST